MSNIVEIALQEVGTTEVPENSNKTKYGKWFGLDALPWCGIFVSYVYYMAGKPLVGLGYKKGFAGCQTAAKLFIEKGWLTLLPEPGDIFLIDFNGDGRYDHTGIFVRWIDNNTFESIEGNTSLTNQSNGGNVMVRKRKKKGVIFAHIP